MRISTGGISTDAVRTNRTAEDISKRLREGNTAAAGGWTVFAGLAQDTTVQENENETAGKVSSDRSEAAKIYEAVAAGRENPIASLREAAKVPYGYLAKDGVIMYNGVCFVCDEETNSICLGDMTDKKNVLNIPLSGGGHLKVNRDSIGLLPKAAGMFSPEDLNLIMRAISQDTRIQAMQKEIEDEEASVGENLQSDGGEDVEQTEAVNTAMPGERRETEE